MIRNFGVKHDQVSHVVWHSHGNESRDGGTGVMGNNRKLI